MQVYAKYIRVGAENYVDVAKPADLAFGHQLKPAVVKLPVLVLEPDILAKVPYHRFAKLKNNANLQQKLELKFIISIFET